MSSAGEARQLGPLTTEAVVSVNEAITRVLREAILQGKLRPGQRLLQDDLASELNVSRQPVREALLRLESEGLVLRSLQRGYVVRAYAEEETRENYRLRELLESEAARMAAERIRPDELTELESLNNAMAREATGDLSRLITLNGRFHHLIHEASRMPTMVRFLNQLWIGRTIFTPLYLAGRAERSVGEHAEIILALAERDPEKAASSMREHIRRAATEYFESRRKEVGSRAGHSVGS